MGSDESTRSAYGARAAEYTSLLGSIGDTHELDRQRIGDWAAGIEGRVVDAGCGPGQWTDFLHRGGTMVQGIDFVPEFIHSARLRFPGVPFRVASFRQMGVPDDSLHGVLAWYSLIHVPPDELALVFAEMGRALVRGGRILIGFFDGPPGTPFPHAVSTAYYWSVEAMGQLLAEAGFEVLEVETRRDPGKRAHAAMTACLV